MSIEKLISASFNASPIGQCILAPTNGLEILAVNDAFLSSVCRSRADIQGKRLFLVFPNDPDNPHSSMRDIEESIRVAIKTRISQIMVAQRYPIEIHQDGRSWFEDRYWSATNTPIFDPDGTLLCISHTTIDITEKVRSEHRLRESEDRLKAYISAASDIFYKMSPDWTHMHELDGRNFLKTTSEWGEYKIEEYVHPLDLELVKETLRKSITNKHIFELEHRVLRKDGTHGWTYSRAIPRLAPNGEIYEWIGAASDITERKLSEEKLKETDRRKDEFLAMLAHELRNPLAPIGSAAELLQRGIMSEEKIRKTSEVIGRQVRHMAGLVDDLLDVSRVTRGLVQLDMTQLDIRNILTDAVEQATPLMQARGHHLVLHLPPDITLVKGDNKRLIQIVSNLLNNAAKYTPEGGIIVLKVEVHTAHVLIEVIDNGIGMTPELMSQVFDLFSQAERTPDRASGGLGIGLALVKSLAQLHRGTAACESAGLGKGSKFTICLPRLLDDDLSSISHIGAYTVQSAHRLSVMVVDDNVDAATMLAMLMEAMGYQVSVEYSASRALEQLNGKPPDIFLLDIGLPEIDGIELAQRLRAIPATAKSVLIAVTGYGHDEDRKRILAAGFNYHLVKPVDIGRLESILLQFG